MSIESDMQLVETLLVAEGHDEAWAAFLRVRAEYGCALAEAEDAADLRVEVAELQRELAGWETGSHFDPGDMAEVARMFHQEAHASRGIPFNFCPQATCEKTRRMLDEDDSWRSGVANCG